MTAINPADIEGELKRLWESLETTKTMRASLFNLILYTQTGHRAGYIHRIAEKVIEKFPSRVIFVSADKQNSKAEVKAEVRILGSSKGEYDVACDYIHIQASAGALAQIPFLVLPHLLPDLPVYLVWAEDPSRDDPLAYPLEQLSNRLIFDSESTDNLPRFARAVLKHKETSCADIADLNWARMESWREVLSATFYSKDRLEKIQSTERIDIAYNAQESAYFCHTQIQAIYLQAWLACQLGWTFTELRCEKKELHFTYTSGGRPLDIHLKPAFYTSLPPGLILSVDISTAQGDHFALIRHPEESHQIDLQFSTPLKCDMPSKFVFSKAESGQSLVKEICHRGTSTHYLNVLHLVKTLEKLTVC